MKDESFEKSASKSPVRKRNIRQAKTSIESIESPNRKSNKKLSLGKVKDSV